MQQEMYEIRGRLPTGRTVTIIGGFRDHDEAVQDALAMDMQGWDDIWVAPSIELTRLDVPALPWRVRWERGRVFLCDADGKQLATLSGNRYRKSETIRLLKEKGLLQ